MTAVSGKAPRARRPYSTRKSRSTWSRTSLFAPLNYVCFLDYATARIFLRKVGGGYIFVHRMLLEYFAAKPQASAERQKCN